jgi:hypothetical protein
MKEKYNNTRDKCKQSRSGCSDYNERAFNRYLLGAMTETEINRLEAHSENCDDCLRTLHRCHVAKEVEKDAEFVSRTKSLLDRVDN